MPSEITSNTDLRENTRTHKVRFPGSTGEQLAGALEIPAGQILQYAVFTHCFTCSKDYIAVHRLSKILAEYGIAVLRFDFTGLGESAGDFSETSFTTNMADIVSAADFLRREYQAPSALIGHSLGGAAALLTGSRIAEVTSVATLAAPSGAKHLQRVLEPARPEIEARGQAVVSIAGRPFVIKKNFLEDISAVNIESALRHFNKRLLVIHSQADKTVAIENAYDIFNAAPSNKSMLTLDNADHLLTNRDDAEYVGIMLANWLLQIPEHK